MRVHSLGVFWFLFQMTSSTKEPKLFVVAGCLRGITALMANFTKTMEEGGMCVCVCVCVCFSIHLTFPNKINGIA